jgi:hypothetical protein
MAGNELGIDPCNCGRNERREIHKLSEKIYGHEMSNAYFQTTLANLRQVKSARTLSNAETVYENSTQCNRALSGLDLKAQQFVDGIRREATADFKRKLTALNVQADLLKKEIAKLLAA